MQPREAAIAGVQEINVAVIGCTATLLLAFLPIMALPEGAGAFVRSLPLAVVTTITASLFVALTIIPFLASRMLPRDSVGKSNVLLDGVMGAIHGIYRPALHLALEHPRKTVAIGLIGFALSLGLVPKLGFSSVSGERQPLLPCRYLHAAGRVGAGNRSRGAVRRWRAGEPPRDRVALRQHRPRQSADLLQRDSARADFQRWAGLCALRRMASHRRHAQRSRKSARELATYPGARINLRRFTNGPPIEAPVAVRISGPDLAAIGEIATEVERILLATPGTREITNPSSERLIDLDLNINDAEAALRGVPAGASIRLCASPSRAQPVAEFRDPAGRRLPCRAARAARGRDAGDGAGDAVRVEWSGRGVAAGGDRRPSAGRRPIVDRSCAARTHGHDHGLHAARLPDQRRDAGCCAAAGIAAAAAWLHGELRRRSGSAGAQLQRARAGDHGRDLRRHGGAAAWSSAPSR